MTEQSSPTLGMLPHLALEDARILRCFEVMSLQPSLLLLSGFTSPAVQPSLSKLLSFAQSGHLKNIGEFPTQNHVVPNDTTLSTLHSSQLDFLILILLRYNLLDSDGISRLISSYEASTMLGMRPERLSYLGDLWVWACNAVAYDQQREYSAPSATASTTTVDHSEPIYPMSGERRGSIHSLHSPRSTELTLRSLTLDRSESVATTISTTSGAVSPSRELTVEGAIVVEEVVEPVKARAHQACDQCSARKVKCNSGQPSCSRCITGGVNCSYTRTPRKRGPNKGVSPRNIVKTQFPTTAPVTSPPVVSPNTYSYSPVQTTVQPSPQPGMTQQMYYPQSYYQPVYHSSSFTAPTSTSPLVNATSVLTAPYMPPSQVYQQQYYAENSQPFPSS